jgi:uncharacterized membrane protein
VAVLSGPGSVHPVEARRGQATSARSPFGAAAVFGVGLGGLVDGIVLHQILQWHHLVSAETSADDLEGLEHNTLADGLFHAATLVVLVAGVVLLWRAALTPAAGWSRHAIAGALVGWGAFNIVDEVVFHLLLDLHHIRMVDDYLVYDLGFALLGAALIAVGLALRRRTT